MFCPVKGQEAAVARLKSPRGIRTIEEAQFKTLRELAGDSTLSQRELSKRTGVSLGKVNYIVGSLLRKGYIRAKRFKNSKNKIGYMYELTPKGISTRLSLTHRFIQRKTEEYERLGREIEMLIGEAETSLKAATDSMKGEQDSWQRF